MAAMDIEMASPVGPLVAVAYDQDHTFGIPAYQSELDLCHLLQAMSLTKGKFKKGARDRNGGLCPTCIAKRKRARCKHGGPGIPFRRVGVIKLKVQLLRPTPRRLSAYLVHHRPPLPVSRMPLPPIHPRFARPRVPRPIALSIPLSRYGRVSDHQRRLPRHPAPSSQSSRRVPSSTQRVPSGAARDREGD